MAHKHNWEWDYDEQWFICKNCPDEDGVNFMVLYPDELLKKVEIFQEFYDAHCEVERGLLSFELHNEAVMRLRKAQEAIEGR